MRLIDADALVNYILSFHDRYTGEDFKYDLIEDAFIYELNNAPTVDAVPVRHGRWTVTPVYIKCSECGESFMLIPQNYCPNCGARMDEE